MGLFDRFRGRRAARGAVGTDPAADLRYLRQWVDEHQGVEAYVEPKTTVTDVTVVLVAADGEWLRFSVPDDRYLRKLSAKHRMPIYDVARMGYPKRMKEYRRDQD